MVLRTKIIILYSICLLLSLFSHSFQAHAQATVPEPVPEIVKSDADLIHYGDLIDVDIIGNTEYDWRGTITPEGFLQGLDFVEEPVYALCQSEESVAASVARGYSKLLRDPKVSVKILDRSKRPQSIIYGAVKSEQRFQIRRAVYLNELIIFAGGITENASGTIEVFRPANLSCNAPKLEKEAAKTSDSRQRFITTGQSGGSANLSIKISDLLKGEKDANPQIFSGDIVTVQTADPIYIIGGVAVPKQISSRANMTLTRAIASAGGLSKDADAKNITVFRRTGQETKIIETNYEKIEAGQNEDISLQALDIVDVGIKGRGKSKYAPIVRNEESGNKIENSLPLRIID